MPISGSEHAECGTLDEPPVLIVMATHNGERFLREQLESILAQTYRNWTLLIRDDVSTDQTPRILRDVARRFSSQIRLLPPSPANAGAKATFKSLIADAIALIRDCDPTDRPALVFFADQDDIWLPHKLRVFVDAWMVTPSNQETPLLIHSDLELIDSDGLRIAPSMAEYQGLFVSYDRVLHQALSNSVTGCAMAVNYPLLLRSVHMDADAVMHDWWMSLVASAFGQRIYLQGPTIQYRQHRANTIGAIQKEGSSSRLKALRGFFSGARCALYIPIARQAAKFVSHYRDDLTWADRFKLRCVAMLDRFPGPVANLLYMVLVTPRNLAAKRAGTR